MHATSSPVPESSAFARPPERFVPIPDARAPEPLPSHAVFGALAGLTGLGAAAALGMLDSDAPLRLVPSVLLVDLGALALTTPALLAIHQFLGLHANVEDLVAALARALVRGGQVAGGLVVVVLAFAVTTDLAIVALLGALLAVGVFTNVVGCRELARVESLARGDRSGILEPRFALTLVGWTILSWAIALRIAVHVGRWVVEA